MLAEILTQIGKQSGRYPGICVRLSHCNIAEMREDLQEVCTRISEKFGSADDRQLAVSLDKPLKLATGFLFGNTELGLERWIVIAGISGFDD